jgi:phage/plasmid-like protein (TIGR03299 family)
MFVLQPAWHGLGKVLESAPETSEQAICEAGLDWSVEKRQLFADNGSGNMLIPVPGNHAVVRTSDASVLGIVGDQYDPIQNRTAFNFFDSFIQTGQVKYDTAGSLHKGRNIWIMAKLEGMMRVGGKDEVAKYLLLHNSHDGSKKLSVMLTPIRVVCNNTLQAALKSQTAQNSLKLKHTRTVNARLDAAAQALAEYNNQFEVALESYDFLASRQCTAALLEQYLDLIFPLPKEREGGRNRAIHEIVKDLFGGKMLGGSDGSFWSAYNAVTEYSDHWSANKNSDTRLESIWFGTLANTKAKALESALQLASAA